MAELGEITATSDPALISQVERELLAALARINRQTASHRRTFVIKDRSGQLQAGITCSTAYGWLHIETLWVADAVRARGLGRRLMTTAEAFGREHGCHGAWLDTSNAGACAFYQRLGYRIFGKLANGENRSPSEHKRWFLKRALEEPIR